MGLFGLKIWVYLA